ncbi:MAG: hypothetical protein KF708_14775 [Pirellulales bacterium]|nr:hypothetical protein [Pirellulales bacterium]
MANVHTAIRGLLQAGFTEDQITVVCSDEEKVSSLRNFEHQHPSGSSTPLFASTGGVIGATLSGLAAFGGTLASGGDPGLVLASSGLATWTGGILGGLVGAMMTRGIEKELANYYSQAVQEGKIIVAAEDMSEHPEAHLRQAEEILAAAGSEPIALPEG